MSFDQSSSRRQFLKALLALYGSSLTGLAGSSAPAAPSGGSYKIAPWAGDDFTLGHRMKAGDFPKFPANVEKTVDFVIVGGGMSGLNAAYQLRDHNFLLLEQYNELGGQSRGRSYRGIDFSLGAAYLGSADGIFGELYSELGIKPVKIPPSKNSWFWERQWLPGVSAHNEINLYKEFDRLLSEAKKIWSTLPTWGSTGPLAPELEKLDSTIFASYLQGYNPKFVELIDRFCMSALCGGVNSISALAGFYLLEDLTHPSYVFPGGNPALAKALAARLQKSGRGRCLTGTFVWNVIPKENGAEVIYSDATGSMHRIACRKVIVTAPPMVTARIIPDLDDKVKASLLWQKYGSYLVANFCLRKKTFSGSYDNWVGSPFTFSDFVVAETPYLEAGTYKPEMGSVLTVYNPYPASSAGRGILLMGDKEELSAKLVDQLEKLVEHFQGNLEEVVLSRWGHAMVVASPSFFSKISKLASLDTGPIILAHCSTAGLPAAESAIIAARRAALSALGKRDM